MNEQREHKKLSTQDLADCAKFSIDRAMSMLNSSEDGLRQDEAA